MRVPHLREASPTSRSPPGRACRSRPWACGGPAFQDDSHGLGRRRRVGVRGSTGVRLRAPVGGSDVTMSGSSRVFSAWSRSSWRSVRGCIWHRQPVVAASATSSSRSRKRERAPCGRAARAAWPAPARPGTCVPRARRHGPQRRLPRPSSSSWCRPGSLRRLVDGSGKILIHAKIFAASQTIPAQRASKLLLTLGTAAGMNSARGSYARARADAASVGALVARLRDQPRGPARQAGEAGGRRAATR
jgi:hypothetical protein